MGSLTKFLVSHDLLSNLTLLTAIQLRALIFLLFGLPRLLNIHPLRHRDPMRLDCRTIRLPSAVGLNFAASKAASAIFRAARVPVSSIV
jgi:hypothetical protein